MPGDCPQKKKENIFRCNSVARLEKGFLNPQENRPSSWWDIFLTRVPRFRTLNARARDHDAREYAHAKPDRYA
jgi:hypothetical protein